MSLKSQLQSHRRSNAGVDWMERHYRLTDATIDRNQAVSCGSSMDIMEQARAAYEAGAYQAARESCKVLLARAPGDAGALALLASIEAELGNLEDAVVVASQAVASAPDDAVAHFTLGRLHEMLHRLADAEACYRAAIERSPRYAKAHNNLGVVLQMQGRGREALFAYRQAVELDPLLPEANQNYASMSRDRQALERAVEGFQRRIKSGSRDAATYSSLGNAYRELGRHEEAVESYERAITLDPDNADAHFNLAHVLLQQGRYERGWQEYEWRLRTPAYGGPGQRFEKPLWHGRETAHTVLLHAEQGLGDTIQFARYVHEAAPRCGAIVLECQPELKTLLQFMKGAPQIVARGDPLPPFAMQAPLMSLPAMLGTTFSTIPWPGPYLRPPPAHVNAWRGAFRKRRRRFNVGLVWAGRPQHWDDLNRSVALEQLAPLAKVAGVGFFSLQKGDAAAEGAAPPAGMELFDLSSKLADFADTAALVGFLDLVISVDTSVAHLAAAMGRPTWVLIPRAPDWRHHLQREDNPWYPSMRLFRQDRDGDWASPVERMTEALAAAAATYKDDRWNKRSRI